MTSTTRRTSTEGKGRTRSSADLRAGSVVPAPASRKGVTVTLAHDVFHGETESTAAPSLERRFEMSDKVGEGGMGAVFAARDSKLGRTVAIKVLAGAHQRDGKLRSRFLVEAQVGAQLEHPNIVPLYSFELTAKGAPAIAMQLVEGRTMATYITECAAAVALNPNAEEISLKRRIERLLPVCDAIDYAHGRGVIHRDLKPENVMLGHHNEVFVMDWGIARVSLSLAADRGPEDPGEGAAPPQTLDLSALGFTTGATRQLAGLPPREAGSPTDGQAVRNDVAKPNPAHATMAGELIGTMQYMSPEQAQGKTDETAEATDQFSLGLMLYELATLRPARGQSQMVELYVAATAGTYAPLTNERGQPLDRGLSAIIRKATAYDATLRYASVRDFAGDVGRYLRDEELDVLPDNLAVRIARRIMARPVLALSIVFALLASAAVVAGASLRHDAITARRSAHSVEAISQVTAAVGRRAHEVNKSFDLTAKVVELIGGRARDVLQFAAPTPVAYVRASDMEKGGPPDTRLFDRYGARVSFMEPMFVFPGGEATAEREAMAYKLYGMKDALREALLQSVSEKLAHAPRAEQDEVFWKGDVPLFRVGVAFENGLLFQLPARSGFGADYDARNRPWYKELAGSYGTRWGRPFRDSGGMTVRIPCLAPIWNGDRFVGIALGDLRYEELLRVISMPEVDGYLDSYVLDDDGLVIVDKALLTSKEPLDNSMLPLHPPSRLALRKAVAEHQTSGTFVVGDALVVFTKMIAPPWYFVAEFDSKKYLLP